MIAARCHRSINFISLRLPYTKGAAQLSKQTEVKGSRMTFCCSTGCSGGKRLHKDVEHYEAVQFFLAHARCIQPALIWQTSAIQRSWEMLIDNEQFIFARLSVFRGGFASDAARMWRRHHCQILRRSLKNRSFNLSRNHQDLSTHAPVAKCIIMFANLRSPADL